MTVPAFLLPATQNLDYTKCGVLSQTQYPIQQSDFVVTDMKIVFKICGFI